MTYLRAQKTLSHSKLYMTESVCLMFRYLYGLHAEIAPHDYGCKNSFSLEITKDAHTESVTRGHHHLESAITATLWDMGFATSHSVDSWVFQAIPTSINNLIV